MPATPNLLVRFNARIVTSDTRPALLSVRCRVPSLTDTLVDRGQVHTAGYGSLGLGPDRLELAAPTRIDALDGTTAIRAAYGYAASITRTRLRLTPVMLLLDVRVQTARCMSGDWGPADAWASVAT
jgi:hypothetical protein